MNKILRNGIVLPVALGTLLATSLGVASAPAAARDKDRQEQRQERREQRQERRQEHRQEIRQDRREDRREQRQDRRDDRRQAIQDIRKDRRQEIRQDRREHRQEIRQDRREARQDLRQDRREHRQDLRQRRAHERYRNDYQRRLRAFNSRHYSPRWYHSGNYRYFRGGHWYRVNHYGADLLRQAIDQGYREGLRAGRADRYDGWRGGYRNSSVWIDASFGYVGSYVSRAEYNYYFRQGFERGYDDGLYGRHRYGRPVNGEVIIIDAVLRAILDLQRWG